MKRWIKASKDYSHLLSKNRYFDIDNSQYRWSLHGGRALYDYIDDCQDSSELIDIFNFIIRHKEVGAEDKLNTFEKRSAIERITDNDNCPEYIYDRLFSSKKLFNVIKVELKHIAKNALNSPNVSQELKNKIQDMVFDYFTKD